MVASGFNLLAHAIWNGALAVHFDTEYGGVLTQAGTGGKSRIGGGVGYVGDGFAAALK